MNTKSDGQKNTSVTAELDNTRARFDKRLVMAIASLLGVVFIVIGIAAEQGSKRYKDARNELTSATPTKTITTTTPSPILQTTRENSATQSAPAAQTQPTATANVSSAPPDTSYYSPEYDCEYVSIPHKTVYKDVSWLDIGETQSGIIYGETGRDGIKDVCKDGTTTVMYEPQDKVIYRGTRQGGASSSTPIPTTYQNAAAKQACDSNYSSALGQLSAAGAASGSGMAQLQSIHNQCLRNAGY